MSFRWENDRINNRLINGTIYVIKEMEKKIKNFFINVFGYLRTKTGQAIMSVLKLFTSLINYIRRIDVLITNIIASLIGILSVITLLVTKNQHLLNQIDNPDGIFLAVGGLLGTILALVLSLSIIPIQNAAVNLTQSVIKLYREDRLSRYVFSSLSISCLTSFIFVFLNNIGFNKPILLMVEILILTFSLDLLRFYHRHIIILLGTDKGITKLRDEIKNRISWFQKNVSFLAKIKRLSMSKGNKQKLSFNQHQLEGVLYSGSYSMVRSFKVMIDELAKTALKAISRNEIYRAQLAIFGILDVACHYIKIRSNNMIIYNEPGTFGVKGSDIDRLLTPIYEHYKDISRSALALRNETSSLHAVQALAQIAICLTKVSTSAYKKYSSPLTHMPIAYIGVCIENAQRQSLEEVPHQGAIELLEIVKNTPKNVSVSDVYLPVLSQLNKIALVFIVSNKDAFLNSCVEKMMMVSHHAVHNKHFNSTYIIDDIMGKVEALLSLALSYEKLYDAKFLGQPLTPVFDLSNQVSLGYLVARATILNKKENGKDWINPYNKFIEFNKKIQRHLYDIGKNNEFANSFILWHILHTIKHIADVFLQLLEKPLTKNTAHLDKLISCFSWYCSFFWLAFNKKKIINYQNAQEACDISGYIGLNFYRHKKYDIVKFCINNIASITESYVEFSKQNKNYNEFNILDLLMPLWHFHLVAEKDGNSAIVKIVKGKLDKFGVFKEDSKENEAFENRKRHLSRDLSGGLHWSRYDKSIDILNGLLEGETNSGS